MVGNIIELHNPTAKIAYMAKVPLAVTAVAISRIANTECNASKREGDTLVINAEPKKRPTMAPPQ